MIKSIFIHLYEDTVGQVGCLKPLQIVPEMLEMV